MRTFRLIALAAALLAATTTAFAQATTTAADISRLDTTATEIRRQIETVRQTDATLADELAKSLAELADEVTYLRVKMKREGAVTRDEYSGLRDRLETLRIRAEGQKVVTAQPVLGNPEPQPASSVPVGTEFDVRLQTALSSGTATVEQRFEATTVIDYSSGATVLVPGGSVMRGFVSSVRPAGKIERRGSLTLSFDEIRIGNTTYRLRAAVTEAIDGKVGEDATRIGAGAAVGAILGGLFGGGRGALLGVLVGGGGTIAATDGSDVELPVGTILRVRLDQALSLAAPAR
jgi:hypothetical protein